MPRSPRRRHKARGKGIPFFTGVPKEVAGLRYWWDFSEIQTLFQNAGLSVPVTTAGQQILGVRDKNNTVNISSGNGPDYRTGASGINNLSVAEFSGANDRLDGNVAADASFTTFIVAIKTTAIDATTDCLWARGGTNRALVTDSDLSATQYVWNVNEAAGAVPVGGVPTDVNVITLRVNSLTSMDVYMNGGTPVNFDPANAVTTSTAIELGIDGSNFGPYKVGEVTEHDTALSSADMNTIGNYLASKWGTTWTSI